MKEFNFRKKEHHLLRCSGSYALLKKIVIANIGIVPK